MSLPLNLNGAEFEALVTQAVDLLRPFLDGMGQMPASRTDRPTERARAISLDMPAAGGDAEALIRRLVHDVTAIGINTTHPGFFGYIPGGGLPSTAVANLIGDVINRYVGAWQPAPGLVQLELDALRWLTELVGYGDEALGYFSSGGSMATLSAVVTARRRTFAPDADYRTARIYYSAETHHCVAKAAMLAGFAPSCLRALPADAAFRLDRGALREAITADRAAGAQPMMVIGNAGTTNTGAVDDLGALADLAQAEALWLHVDAAYGGFFLLTERGRATLKGIERADSITLDPHKGLFLPYGTGALLVRRGDDLRRAHALTSEYLPPAPAHADQVDFHEISPELSRGPRGLRMWLPLQLHGVDAFARELDIKLDLASLAADALSADPRVTLLVRPQLSAFAFRLEGSDALNQAWLDAINGRGRVFLSSTRLDGRLALRLCVLCLRSRRPHVDAFLEDSRAALDQLSI